MQGRPAPPAGTSPEDCGSANVSDETRPPSTPPGGAVPPAQKPAPPQAPAIPAAGPKPAAPAKVSLTAEVESSVLNALKEKFPQAIQAVAFFAGEVTVLLDKESLDRKSVV